MRQDTELAKVVETAGEQAPILRPAHGPEAAGPNVHETQKLLVLQNAQDQRRTRLVHHEPCASILYIKNF